MNTPTQEEKPGKCPQCNYSVAPTLIKHERKHFDGYRLECVRCHYSTETKSSEAVAVTAWNAARVEGAKEGWIQVSERAPERDVPAYWYDDNDERQRWPEEDYAEVIAYNPVMGVFRARYDQSGHWAEVASFGSKGSDIVLPTHWQPLPAPPQTTKPDNQQ